MNRLTKLGTAISLGTVGLLMASGAFAQSLDASETVAVINSVDHAAEVVFTNTSPETVGAFDFELTYNSANLTITTPDITTNHAGTACSVPMAGQILCFANPTVGLTLPASITITMLFDVGATVQVEPLAFGTVNMFDSGGGGVTPTLDDGSITVQTAPPDVTLSYTPTPGTTVNFTGGTGVAGSTSTASITADAGGTNGTATVTACGFSGGTPGAFALTSGDLSIPAGGSDTIDMTCTRALAAQSSTLTCTENDSDSTDTPRSWPVSCPAGTPVPTPEYSSVPAPGGTIDCSGAPASTTTGTLTITNTGIAGSGSDLTYSCTEPPTANFTITSGGAGTVTVGNTAQVQIQCLTPAAAGDPDNTDTLACTTNDTGGTDGVDESSVSYNLVAGVLTAPPPEREASVIPVSSLWSKLMLIGLLLGLGGVALSLRRH